MNRRRQQIAIKQEAAAGTFETLAAADVIEHSGIANFKAEPEMTPRDSVSSSLSPRGSVVGARSARISFAMKLGGSYNHTTGAIAAPAAGTEAPWHVPFLGAGWANTISGGSPSEQNSYKPSSSTISDETTGAYVSIALYEDGKLYKIHGAQASRCVLTFALGQPVMAELEFLGVYNAPTDAAFLSGPVYPTFLPPAFLGASLSLIGSYATAKVRSFSIDMGLETTLRPYPNGAAGFFTAQIVNRNPTFNIDPEEVLAATNDFWAQWIAGTTGAIATGVFPSGGTNYNQLSLSIPNAAYTKVDLDNRDGMSNAAVEGECRANSVAGDDEVELIQT